MTSRSPGDASTIALVIGCMVFATTVFATTAFAEAPPPSPPPPQPASSAPPSEADQSTTRIETRRPVWEPYDTTTVATQIGLGILAHIGGALVGFGGVIWACDEQTSANINDCFGYALGAGGVVSIAAGAATIYGTGRWTGGNGGFLSTLLGDFIGVAVLGLVGIVESDALAGTLILGGPLAGSIMGMVFFNESAETVYPGSEDDDSERDEIIREKMGFRPLVTPTEDGVTFGLGGYF